MEYDIVIVGGGPAGTTAGIRAQQLGLSTCIIDKSIFPRKKLCGGLVSEKAFSLLQEINSNINCSKDSSYITNSVNLCYKSKVFSSFETNIPLYFVNREEFDNTLMNEYKSYGGTLMTCNISKDNYSIDTNSIKIKNETIKYRFLVGADGANSIARKFVDSKYRANGFCLECEIDRAELDNKDKDKAQIFFGVIEKGYGWVFPKKDTYTIGLGGAIRDMKDIKASFHTFLFDLGIEPTTKYSGATIPYGRYPKRSSKKNLFLIGDAAGLVDPITGEGIYYSIESGKEIAELIHKSENINIHRVYKNYLKEKHKHIKAGNRLQSLVFNNTIQSKLFIKNKNKDSRFRDIIDQYISKQSKNYNELFSIKKLLRK